MKDDRKRKASSTKTMSKWAKTDKSANAQARQIQSLSRQVKALQRNSMSWAQYQRSLVDVDVAEPYFSDLLIRPNEWTSIFQADDEANKANKFKARSIGLEYAVGIETGGTPMMCTAFLVRVKPECAAQFLQETVHGTSLTAGKHYVQAPTGAVTGPSLTMLNKAYFKILNVDRFQLGNYTQYREAIHETVSNLDDCVHRKYLKIPYQCQFKTGSGDSFGTELGWKSLTYEQVAPEDHILLYIFNNANTLVGDPPVVNRISVSLNMVITGQVPN